MAPTERPALPPRAMGPIAEQANIYASHVASRAKLYDEAKASGRLLWNSTPKRSAPPNFATGTSARSSLMIRNS
jgi:hypothetical protein